MVGVLVDSRRLLVKSRIPNLLEMLFEVWTPGKARPLRSCAKITLSQLLAHLTSRCATSSSMF